MAPAAVLARLGSKPSGLSDEEAAARLVRFGPNRLPRPKRPNSLVLFLRQFRSPLIYILLAAAAVSLLLGEVLEAAFILGVLLLNALIGAVQEGRAGASAQALERLVRQIALVRRDGRRLEIETEDLVPGDIVELESGMRVGADLRLLERRDLVADEAALTGESTPVEKSAEAGLAAATPLADRTTMLHAGSTIMRGRGRAIVVATGSGTVLGRIAGSLASAEATAPPLIARIQDLGQRIMIVVGVAILAMAAAMGWAGSPPAEIFFLAVALAVSAVPEGLPVAVTVALAVATRRMARRNVIVRTLPAVEGLGACTHVATDKTGTLTANRMRAERLFLADGTLVDRAGRDEGKVERGRPELRALLRTAVLCNEAAIDDRGVASGDAVDAALLELGWELGVDPARHRSACPVLANIPYEPERRFAAVVARGADGQAQIHVKGAVETVLAMCERGACAAAAAAADQLAASGFRVLALALGQVAGEEVLEPEGILGHGRLRLLGLVALQDPVRPEVPDAITRCRRAGVAISMITGDHPRTALAIAGSIGLAARPEQVVTGAELDALAADPEAFAARVSQASVFARVEPAQKLAIVGALRRRGEVVAVTGDGVNDAPALRAADIGVAMGKGGTDVARGAADLLLADDNFASIVAGIEEGRVVYANIRKIVAMVLATGLAELGMILCALATGLPAPLSPVQLLWLNVVTNGIQDVALGLERGEPGMLDRPPRRPSEPIVDRSMLALMLPAALYMTAVAVLTFALALDAGLTEAAARNLVLLQTVVFQNAFVLVIRSERVSILAVPFTANPWLVGGIAAALGIHLAAQHLPPLRAILETAPIPAASWLLVIATAFGLVILTEAIKLARRLLHDQPQHRRYGTSRPLRVGSHGTERTVSSTFEPAELERPCVR